MTVSNPERWTGLGFVATTVNAPPEALVAIEGISAAAIQVIWGTTPNALSRSFRERHVRGASSPRSVSSGWIDEARRVGLEPAGWGWCDARDEAAASDEGAVHARHVLELGLDLYVANMEEPYDAHGDGASPRFHMPDAYLEAFRGIAPDVELAVTTTPRWASNHAAVREAGCVLMGQAFSLEVPSPPGPATVDAIVEFGKSWGWEPRYLRPLVQVYETNGAVPPAKPYLDESAKHSVGVVPYILEQALGGAGRALLTDLVPAIERPPASSTVPPTNGGTVPDDAIPTPKPNETIGPDHGLTALVDYLQRQPGMPVRDPAKYNPAKPATWPWPERLERTLKILAADHDAALE